MFLVLLDRCKQCLTLDGSHVKMTLFGNPNGASTFQVIISVFCSGGANKNIATVVFARERHVLFNDTLNTFYLWLYGIRHMVKDHSDSEKGNPLPPHRLLLSINSKGSFICIIPQTG